MKNNSHGLAHSFTTERLLIRPLLATDRNLYCQLYTNKRIMRQIIEPLTQQHADKAFNAAIKSQNKLPFKLMTWAIVDKATTQPIGILALNRQSEKLLPPNTPKFEPESQAEIGVMLLPVHQGKLLPEEAIASLIDYGFESLELSSITAFFTKTNLATKRIAKKLDFIFYSAVTNTWANDDKNPQDQFRAMVQKSTWRNKQQRNEGYQADNQPE